MKDTDGKKLSANARDVDLLTDYEFLERPQQNTDEELKKLVNPDLHYSKDQPMSFWVEKLNHGNFYKSVHADQKGNPFAKNNEFLTEYPVYTNKKL